jgi:DNA-directed RNA polymerase subunit RPC12/RpoP
MPQSLECPNCHAPLTLDGKRPSATVRCDYCGSTVIVPEEVRGLRHDSGARLDHAFVLAEAAQLVQNGRKIEAIKQVREAFGIGLKEAKDIVDAIERNELVQFGDMSLGTVRVQTTSSMSRSQVTRSPWLRAGCVLLVLVIVASFVVPILLGGGMIWWAGSQAEEAGLFEVIEQGLSGTAVAEIPIPAMVTMAPEATPTPAFAQVVQQFGGEEGIGPGFFNDTRRLAVDGAGNIYTGDYSDGRIQVFGADGAFNLQMNVGEDLYMSAMTVTRDGIVIVSNNYQILRFHGATGAAIDTLPYEILARTMTTAPDGSVIILAEERLLRLDAQGNVTLDLTDPFADIPDFAMTHEDVAVDGAGNMYVLGRETVYKLDANGRYITRIGSKGDEDDQFHTSPTSLAVDGKGRLYVADFFGIKVFDENGRYLEIIPFEGVAFDMVFTPQNQLLVMDRNGNQVLTYDLNE